MGDSLEIEISADKLDQLVRVASSSDETGLAQAAADIPRLVIEINRLRQERDERIAERNSAHRKINEQKAYIESMRPSAQAESRLREMEARVPAIVARAEKAERDLDEAKRTIEQMEGRIRSLLDSLVEMARGRKGAAKDTETDDDGQ